MEKIYRIIEDIYYKCMLMKKDDPNVDSISIIFDGFGYPLAEKFIDYGYDNSFSIVNYYVPYSIQSNLVNHSKTCSRIIENISNSTILINLLNSSSDCTEFRIAVVQKALGENMKVLHLPGVSESILLNGLNNLDYSSLHQRCKIVSTKLETTKNIKIISKSCDGNFFELNIPLANRKSHICGGIAENGEIMNLPTGEAFIAPLENEANGKIVINGSGPSVVFHEKDEVILSFHNGAINISECKFSSTPNGKRFEQLLLDSSQLDGTLYQICEFGVGLNDTIKSLTGEIILDEKMKGTFHIALGNNIPFGGNLKSKFHHDLIFVPNEILLDNNKLEV